MEAHRYWRKTPFGAAAGSLRGHGRLLGLREVINYRRYIALFVILLIAARVAWVLSPPKLILRVEGGSNLSQPDLPIDSVSVTTPLVTDGKVLAQAIACLRDSPFAPNPLPPLLLTKLGKQIPTDIVQHYKEILVLTQDFRRAQWSSYAGYDGPWIENAFIGAFCCDKPLSMFGGMVPLFIQWTDLWHLNGEHFWITTQGKRLRAALRQDVVYVTVSQHDQGIVWNGNYVASVQLWNVLVLSSGGFGHVALPLLSKELMPVQHRDLQNLSTMMVFAGTINRFPVRRKMKKILQATASRLESFNYRLYTGPLWREAMESAMLNLSPRGYGRSAFRTSELIQSGLLPVYIFDDHDWSPYKGTDAHISQFGWALHIDKFEAFLNDTIVGLTQDPNYLMIEDRTRKMLAVRASHYTFPGVLNKLALFFAGDPASDLSCQRHPMHPIDEKLLYESESKLWVLEE